MHQTPLHHVTPGSGEHGVANRAADHSTARHRHYVWLAAAVLTALPLLFALTREMWEAPFPITETVSILETVRVLSDTADSAHPVVDPTVVSFVDPNTRSWYRPFYWATWYAFWHGTHSIDATLLLFRLLEILTTVVLVLGFIWYSGPRSFLEYASATVALAIFVGTPGFRENLEIPLPMTLVGMQFALIAWVLLEREHRSWHGPVLVLLAVLAVGYKEQGLVLVPVIVAAWWVGAPGVRLRTAATITVLTLAYLVMRFSTTGSWNPFEQDVGLGFEMVPRDTAAARFAAFPYLIYAYNAAATVGNILFSEPTDGIFQVVRAVVDRDVEAWQVNHVLTSAATTALIAWWSIGTWKKEASGTWSPKSRLIVALVLAVAASGALGFNYSRDRLGGMAVMFYALAAYYALREAGSRLARAGGPRLAAASVAFLLLAAGWQVRAIGTVDSVHARARSAYREWIADRQELRFAGDRSELYLRILEALEPQGTAPIRVHTYGWDSR